MTPTLEPTGSTEPTKPIEPTQGQEEGPYVYEGNASVAPYAIYNLDGSLLKG